MSIYNSYSADTNQFPIYSDFRQILIMVIRSVSRFRRATLRQRKNTHKNLRKWPNVLWLGRLSADKYVRICDINSFNTINDRFTFASLLSPTTCLRIESIDVYWYRADGLDDCIISIFLESDHFRLRSYQFCPKMLKCLFWTFATTQHSFVSFDDVYWVLGAWAACCLIKQCTVRISK